MIDLTPALLPTFMAGVALLVAVFYGGVVVFVGIRHAVRVRNPNAPLLTFVKAYLTNEVPEYDWRAMAVHFCTVELYWIALSPVLLATLLGLESLANYWI